MKIFKKNQLVILVIALMLVTAGYLSYDANNNNNNNNNNTEIATSANVSFGDAALVNSGNVSTAQEGLVENEDASSIATSANETDNKDYFITSKLERETMYSGMLENYQKIINDTNASNEQKNKATDEIKKINDTKNSIMIAENLIKTKGMEDVIIFVNDESINVVVKAEKLEGDSVAQIQNIVGRELKAKAENIHITNK